MGIPSYYKKLSDKIKGLITKSRPSNASALFFDFNCLIYHCARRPNSKLPPYPGDEGRKEWEDALLHDIVKYVQYIWHQAGEPAEVFLSVDGVVPMAKIKQQRLRRFKSVWLNSQDPQSNQKPVWDTNCITPGTDFMKRLAAKLQELCNKHRGWKLSSDQEGGEGEHKIMRLLRERPNQKSPIFVYGLDADLILLTLLNSPCQAYLMREDAEMGVPNTDIFGEESYSYFSLDILKKAIFGEREVAYDEILEYVTAMSFLGNDFLPHSLSIKIREDGHNFLLSELKEMKRQEKKLLKREEDLWKVDYTTVEWLLQRWALQEEDRLAHSFKKKIQMRSNTELTIETKPLENPVEQKILHVSDRVWSLKKGWQTVYREEWLFCKTQQDIDLCCREYLVGLQWILDYYTGQRQVDMTWYYPRLIPALWQDIYKYMQAKKEIPQPRISQQNPILPEEQLVMVLPLQSWHYIPTTSPHKLLPSQKPQFWPSKFGFFTAGRIRTWECEPLLPILPIEQVRSRA